MPVDLSIGASHNAQNHPIETPKLSHPSCVVRVDLAETGESRSRTRWSSAKSLVSCRECGPGAADCSLVPLIAVSDAENVVLRAGIDANNVVLKTR